MSYVFKSREKKSRENPPNKKEVLKIRAEMDEMKNKSRTARKI